MIAFDPSTVAAIHLSRPEYPKIPPFHPDVDYPEYRGEVGKEPNLAYGGVRECFRLLGLDAAHYGTADWNPLGDLVRPGDRVVLKPNLLAEAHALRPEEWIQVITHGSVIRAVLDYVLLALKGKGEVSVMDGPQYDSDWDRIMNRSGLRDVVQYCSSVADVPIQLLDLRDYQQEVRDDVICNRIKLPSDPQGGMQVDLGEYSALTNHEGAGRYYGSDYDQTETNGHHSGGKHEYRISRTATAADVFINIPKLKTHKKVGVTLCMKNLVGINLGRNWLPHHTDGDPSGGGDQFPFPSVKTTVERSAIRWLQRQSMRVAGMPFVYRLAKRAGKRIFGRTDQVIRHGNWHGNDTCWRMVLDINRLLLYADENDFPGESKKRYFAVVDGIIGGEGDGPASPDSYPAGIVLAGWNPVAVDCVGARLMGFDVRSIPQLAQAFETHPLPLVDFPMEAIHLRSNNESWIKSLHQISSDCTFHFRPHFGWIGHIESKP
jgi:uncharacterized protein (DUF362 family)